MRNEVLVMYIYKDDEDDDDVYIVIVLDDGRRIKLRWGSARYLQILLNDLMG